MRIIDIKNSDQVVAEIATPIGLNDYYVSVEDGGDNVEYQIHPDDMAAWKLAEHAKIVGAKVGGILSAVTKDLQTQANIQAKFSLISSKGVASRSTSEKAIHAATIALAEWVGATMTIGNNLKTDINADITAAAWPEFEANHKMVIAALVAEL